MYTRILDRRVRGFLEEGIDEKQAAFHLGRQTQDHSFSLRMVEKAWDRGCNVYPAFLDLVAAFDSVPRQDPCNALNEKKIPSSLSAQ